jgi:hypothetical protein
MITEKKLRLQNITWKATLLCGSEPCIIKRRDKQELELIRMRFLRPLLDSKTLDRQSSSYILRRVNV